MQSEAKQSSFAAYPTICAMLTHGIRASNYYADRTMYTVIYSMYESSYTLDMQSLSRLYNRGFTLYKRYYEEIYQAMGSEKNMQRFADDWLELEERISEFNTIYEHNRRFITETNDLKSLHRAVACDARKKHVFQLFEKSNEKQLCESIRSMCEDLDDMKIVHTAYSNANNAIFNIYYINGKRFNESADERMRYTQHEDLYFILRCHAKIADEKLVQMINTQTIASISKKKIIIRKLFLEIIRFYIDIRKLSGEDRDVSIQEKKKEIMARFEFVCVK